MFSQRLLLYCFLGSGTYLILISLVTEYLHKKLRLSQGIPKELLEDSGCSWSGIRFMMEALFFVVIPTLAYSLFYLVIPLSGIKAGMSAALFAFTLGAAPALMSLSVRVKLPMPYILFLLLSLLFKLGGSLIIIGYLYSL